MNSRTIKQSMVSGMALDALAQNVNYGFWEWNIAEDALTISEQLYNMTGYSAVELAGSDLPMQGLMHADDAQKRRDYVEKCMQGRCPDEQVFYKLQHKNSGKVVWLQEICSVAKTDAAGRVLVLAGIVYDVTHFTRMEEEYGEQLKSDMELAVLDSVVQSRLLEAISHIAGQLVAAEPEVFETEMWKALGTLGEAAGVDRAYIWQNYTEDGHLFCRQTYEWSEGAEPQQGIGVAAAMDYDDVPYWKASVERGEPINAVVKDLPESERAALEPQGIVSILVMPIRHGGDVWGFFGFDDCEAERVFTKAEEKTLRSAGVLMVSAIIRNEMLKAQREIQDALQEKEKLLWAANTTATMLLDDSEGDFEKVMVAALRELGETMETDRAYIWRNSVVEGQLCCSQVAEWARGKPSHEGGEGPQNLPYDEFVPSWQQILEEQSINSLFSELGDVLAAFPGMEDVKSLLVLPIMLHGDFWGFIGFDDCQNERIFRSDQVSILHSGGMLIASGMQRNEMTDRLIEAREEAVASMQAKSDFLARMSHEIRTPMNAIIGMTAIARKSEDPEKIKYCLDKIDGSSRQLLGIINDVLDMSKIDANKLEIITEPFDFERMLQNVFNVVQVKMDEKGQNLRFSFDEVFTRKLVSDELRLSQVLINLLNNAVKFTPDGGEISVEVSSRPAEGGDEDDVTLHVEVVDSGIGIAADRIDKLFNSFEQADGGITRQYGGTGLGLAIVKRIVQLLGGDVRAESEEGEGSRFIFEVAAKWGGGLRPEAEKTLDKNMRILVVDDDIDVLDHFCLMMESFQLRCEQAATGERAVEMVRLGMESGDPYSIVFLDWHMPGMHGRETAREITRITAGQVVVVMISAMDWGDIEQEVKQMGIHNFLPKPILPSALYNTVVDVSQKTLVTQRGEEQTEAYDWSGKRLLLVEDIEINREIVFSILEETGVAIDVATNGREAVDRFAKEGEVYDIILMDVQMPVMDGLSATRAIRAMGTPAAKTVPILAMTANAFKEDERASIAAGMNDHISKPLDVQALLDKMAQLI